MENPAGSEFVLNRPWADSALDVGVEMVSEGQLKAGLTLLQETRGDPERRVQRVNALAESAVGQSKALAMMTVDAENNPELWLWFGSTLIAEASTVRGSGRANTVEEKNFRMFFSLLQDSHQPLMTAAQLLPEDVAPWAKLQPFAMGMELSREDKDTIWKEIENRNSHLFSAHSGRMQILAAKWGGSHDEMFAFAREAVAAAAPGDALAAMIPLAHLEYDVQESNGVTEHEMSKEGPVSDGDQQWIQWRLDYFNWAVDEIKKAGEKWVNSARPHPCDIQAHQLFAAAFALSSDEEAHQRARWHLAQVGNRVAYAPWGYWGDPVEHFVLAQRKLGMR